MGTEILLRPSEIRFTQDSISDEFGRDTGETLEQTFKELLYGEKDPEDIRPLTVVKYHNKYWVISGNRRLFIYRKLEDLGRVEELTVKLRKYNRQRFFEMKTTKNEGASVRVRGKNNLKQKLNNIVTEWKRKGRPTSGLPAYHDYGDDETDYKCNATGYKYDYNSYHDDDTDDDEGGYNNYDYYGNYRSNGYNYDDDDDSDNNNYGYGGDYNNSYNHHDDYNRYDHNEDYYNNFYDRLRDHQRRADTADTDNSWCTIL